MLDRKLSYGHVVVDDVKLHYYRTGDEKPAVILLHGLTDNGLCWGRIAFALEPFYDVIMLDARGHGLSQSAHSGFSIEERAADVAGLIKELGLDKPVIMGHSFGAETAALTAAYYPELVGGIILEDPPFWAEADKETEAGRSERFTNFKEHITEIKNKSFDDLLEYAHKRHPGWDQTELFQWVKSKQQFNMDALKIIQEKRPSWRSFINRIKCPVLLIISENELGGIVTPEVAVEAAEKWKLAKVVQISDAGHNIRRDQYSAFLEVVKDYLKKITNW
ncbi:MAG: alpha/beta hydrolase [Anaerolineaceae bacterium]|nr:alpha/beta hydrolase [Anaerolineaceae bacterium]